MEEFRQASLARARELHRSKRKRKKRRKRRTPRTSSCPLRGRRRQRQWFACSAGFPGDVPLRAVFCSVFGRLVMLGIWPVWTRSDSSSSLNFLAAEADLHGPVCSADHRVSPVAVRFRWSLPLECWSCLSLRARVDNGSLRPRLVMLVTLRLGCVPPRCRRSRAVLRASRPVWTRRTVAVAYTRLVLLVTKHLAVFSSLVRRTMIWHHGRYGPEGQLQWHV